MLHVGFSVAWQAIIATELIKTNRCNKADMRFFKLVRINYIRNAEYLLVYDVMNDGNSMFYCKKCNDTQSVDYEIALHAIHLIFYLK